MRCSGSSCTSGLLPSLATSSAQQHFDLPLSALADPPSLQQQQQQPATPRASPQQLPHQAVSTAAASLLQCCSASAPPACVMDRTQPLVFRVGKLGPKYWEWVHIAEPGAPRFFGPDWAENCTKTPWWVVPLIWLPLFLSCSASALSQQKLPPAQLAALLLTGAVAWQAFEYVMHRCLFHAQPTSYSGITLHFLFHGCHHKYPMDVLRLVMPPLPGGVVIALVYSILTAMLPMGPALGLFSGMGFGYVAYDCLHYAMHHGRRLPRALLGELCARHAKHHHKDHSKGYGISSVMFDALLGTRHKM